MWNFSYSWPFGSFLNIVLLALIICLLAYVSKDTSKKPPETTKKRDEAMDILRKRYASSEINAEEFAQKKKDLETL